MGCRGKHAASPVCVSCGRLDRLGFADETVRNSRYGIAVIVVCPCRAAPLRKLVRGLVRPGVRRLHFTRQQDRDRRQFLARIEQEDLGAIFVTMRGRERDARSACWAALVPRLLALGVTELAIEQMEGGEDRDRRDIRAALIKEGRVRDFCYAHVDPRHEPLLWVADAVAWAAGAGGRWRERVELILARGGP